MIFLGAFAPIKIHSKVNRFSHRKKKNRKILTKTIPIEKYCNPSFGFETKLLKKAGKTPRPFRCMNKAYLAAINSISVG